MPRHVYLLQGLAQNMSHWDKVVALLPADVSVTRVDMLSLGFDGDRFTLARAATDLDHYIKKLMPSFADFPQVR